jgi:type I restriction enzyme M protein
MLSPQLKADIRTLWDRFWSGGIANPLTAIEQITYLVFLKRLEDLDNQRKAEAARTGRPYPSMFEEHATYRWSHIKQLPSEERLDFVRTKVFEWMKKLQQIPGMEERMRDAVFVIPTASLLQSAVEIIDRLFVPSRNEDATGDIYEMLLSEIAEAGKNGQFRTPRHIIRAMCDLLDPRHGESTCDPASGTAGFLVNAYQHILKSNTNRDSLAFQPDGTAVDAFGDLLGSEAHEELRRNHFYGFDFDRTMVRLGWMNLVQHGLEAPKIEFANTLGGVFNERVKAGEIGEFDVVLANPPFTGSIDRDDIGESLRWLGTTKTELLFVELILQLLRVGGRAAVIVPEGLLFGSTRPHRAVREKLVRENQLEAVVSLPSGIFQPYTGVKTSVLIFTRGGSTEQPVWFYEVAADGYSLDARRNGRPERNDLWDLIIKFRLRNADAFPQPMPAFVDSRTWEAWCAMDAATRTFAYAQPLFLPREVEDSDGHLEPVSLFAGVETIKLAEPKDWTATPEVLASSDYNLSAGRYKPTVGIQMHYPPPAEIIRGLQALEQEIQEGLAVLLAGLENEA